jgi:hypothetical protein
LVCLRLADYTTPDNPQGAKCTARPQSPRISVQIAISSTATSSAGGEINLLQSNFNKLKQTSANSEIPYIKLRSDYEAIPSRDGMPGPGLLN